MQNPSFKKKKSYVDAHNINIKLELLYERNQIIEYNCKIPDQQQQPRSEFVRNANYEAHP